MAWPCLPRVLGWGWAFLCSSKEAESAGQYFKLFPEPQERILTSRAFIKPCTQSKWWFLSRCFFALPTTLHQGTKGSWLRTRIPGAHVAPKEGEIASSKGFAVA